MNVETERPTSAATEAGLEAIEQRADRSTPRPAPKRSRVIARLLRGAATSFDLERDCHDHVASATISELRQDGLEIASTLVEVPGYAGQIARIARYELHPASRDRARELLERSRRWRAHGAAS